jgi:hypothetical protein
VNWIEAMAIKLSTTAVLVMIAFATLADVHAGSIMGEVKFTDAPSKLPLIKVTKDQDYCGETLANETYLIDTNGGLKNVVVFIESAPAGKPADPLKENFLYNDGCRYAPRAMAIQLSSLLSCSLFSKARINIVSPEFLLQLNRW